MASRGKYVFAREPHVLLVEGDPAVLAGTSAQLLAAGCEITTARVALDLLERVVRVWPDLVLVDPMMSDLASDDFSRLLARAGDGGPAVVVHTRLRLPLLRSVVDLRQILGVLQKTEDGVEFSRQFHELVERWHSTHAASLGESGQRVATSGTYRIASATPPGALESVPRKRG